jgi:hypothetical protein
LLPRFNPDSIDSCIEIGRELDQQRAKVLPEINEVETLIETLVETKKRFADYLNSDEEKKRFFSPMRGGLIIT